MLPPHMALGRTGWCQQSECWVRYSVTATSSSPPLSFSGLVSLEEGAGRKLSPARKVPNCTRGPMQIALPGPSCFHLKGSQAHTLHSMSGAFTCSMCHHGPALCKDALGLCWRMSLCPCSGVQDLAGRIRPVQMRPTWVLTMAWDFRILEGCSSRQYMGCRYGLCLYTSRDGELTVFKETHSVVGQLHSEKAST